MPEVAVVSDTTAYLPRDTVEDEGIHIVSLYVNYGGDRTEQEVGMADFNAFYDELRSVEELPTTSQPSVGDFVATYAPLLDRGLSVVSVHVSGGLSGTCDSARQAAEGLRRDGRGGERVSVIDSETTAGGLGLLALAAARRAQAGDAAEEIVEHVANARSEMKMWFAVDTLEYLKRSGRVGAASAWIGSTLKVKPILTVEREIAPVERVRTSARAYERMVDYARQRQASGADAWTVQHIQAPDEARRLTERCREIFSTEPAFVSELGPIVGVHAGPGLIGVGALPSRYLA